jgi:hypothetical protein
MMRNYLSGSATKVNESDSRGGGDPRRQHTLISIFNHSV